MMWNCPRCTFENTESVCAMCSYVRQNATLPLAVATSTTLAPPPYYSPRQNISKDTPREKNVKSLSEFVQEEHEDECVLDITVSTSQGNRFELIRVAPGNEIRKQLLEIIKKKEIVPGVRENGSISGADLSYVENMANAGAAGGEAEARGRQRPKQKTSPRRKEFAGNTTRDGGGVRVNAATTKGPIYDNATEFETWAETPTFSQPETSPTVVIERPTPKKSEAIAFETVGAIAAKLRNMARLGGERVREMDHFVESKVETEIVQLEENDEEQSLISARKLVEREARRTLLMNGQTYLLDRNSTQQELIGKYIDLFALVLDRALVILGCPPGTRQSSFRIYYLPTVRADEFVCAKDSDDGYVYVNALAFHQANVCDLDNKNNHPIRVRPSMWSIILPYWCHRLRDLCGNHSAGLYSSEVRHRLAENLFDLCGEAPGFELWLSTNNNERNCTKTNQILPPIDDSDLLQPPIE
uniref:RanBP2-type domain-containing protein n=1 Tax=Aureoumbra lagunensis TaxID=44058 RepID=A0A7S3NL46_9STRA|mmetsp:Transcript_13257/g.17693  ORF Transcript_13257/g.17693 Transcript_13257/m.17693 type:complete len:471 (-) Transcript_13257:1596-3008(-)